jgi:hypothetical protein
MSCTHPALQGWQQTISMQSVLLIVVEQLPVVFKGRLCFEVTSQGGLLMVIYLIRPG